MTGLNYRNLNVNLLLQYSAILTVPGGSSVACSTPMAAKWDPKWSENLDPSGRAALGVHVSAYETPNLASLVS